MRKQKNSTTISLAGAALLLVSPFLIASASARPVYKKIMHHRAPVAQSYVVTNSHTVAHTTHWAVRSYGQPRVAHAYGMSCVPFARAESGIILSGNAWQWWDNAAGRYARGTTPEPGSVLTFRSNGRMRLGHVAVVARVVNGREVLIDHANWPGATIRGGVSASIPVVDVSENNDWSAVRVGLGRGGDFGSVYPTYGFIYDRPDTGTIVANRTAPAGPALALNPAPHDLRPARKFEEVAQAPAHPRRRVGLIMPPSGAR